MAKTTAPSPVYMDFIKPTRRNAEKLLFDQTIKKIFDGKVPSDIDSWVDFITGFSYHDDSKTGEFAYIINFANFNGCSVEILKQNLDLEPHISVRRNSVAVDVGTQRYYIPIEYANLSDVIDISIKIGKLNQTLAKMPPEKAKRSKEYVMRSELISTISQISFGHYDRYTTVHKTGTTYEERQQALVSTLKDNLIKRQILPKETTFKKYHLGKTLDEAYSACKKIVEKIAQKTTSTQQQNNESTPEM